MSSNKENSSSQMGDTEKRDEEEEDLLSNEDENNPFESYVEQFTFSDFLIKIVDGTRRTFFKEGSILHTIPMIICTVVFLLALIMGASFLSTCPYERMICIFLIVQGVFGFVVVLIHVTATVLNWHMGQSIRIKWILLFAHCLVVFCVIWFILGHVWVFQKPHLSISESSCRTAASPMGVFLILFDYMIGFGYLLSRLWNSPSALHRLETLIHRQIEAIPRQHVLAMADEPTMADEQEMVFINVNRSHIVFLLMGALLSGIPLLVVFSMLTNNTSSLDTTGTSNPVHLPLQCFAYTLNTDSTRIHTHHNYGGSDDRSLTTGWYRFQGAAGTRLLTKQPPSTNQCGGSYPGWWNGTLPLEIGRTSGGYVCFFTGSSCLDPVLPVAATNCSGFYVFYLSSSSQYNYRYCTEP